MSGPAATDMRFLPPDPGEWRIVDHIARPGTRCFADYYYGPMQDAWNEEARRIGLLNRVTIREVEGFMYYRMELVSSPAESVAMHDLAGRYWVDKGFLTDLETWDRVVRPAAVDELLAAQAVPLAELPDDALVHHLDRCLAMTRRMVRDHHRFTYTALLPVGDVVRWACARTGEGPLDVLLALQDGVPRLLVGVFDPLVDDLVGRLRDSTSARILLSAANRSPERAAEFLASLLALDGDLAAGLEHLQRRYGHRLVDGYDIASPTLAERPDLLLKALSSAVDGPRGPRRQGGALDRLRALVPPRERPAFEEMLVDVRRMLRLRNERGVCTDLWAGAVLRAAYLEAGRRLAAWGVVEAADTVLDAGPNELAGLLRGSPSVTATELRNRAAYRHAVSVADAPAVLTGPPSSVAPLPIVSSAMERSMLGLATAIALAVDRPAAATGAGAGREGTLVGVAASTGVVRGRARVVTFDGDLTDVQCGDVLVLRQATAAFAAVLPIAGGIVSEFGGVLSHPAILSREQAIPCVVGCAGATTRIRTGATVVVDGARGTVEILPEAP